MGEERHNMGRIDRGGYFPLVALTASTFFSEVRQNCESIISLQENCRGLRTKTRVRRQPMEYGGVS